MLKGDTPQTGEPENTGSPRHVAIIMDGNGRWAAARGLPRAEGHRRGVEALRKVLRAAHELGISYLTIFSFSSENWSRPASEIVDLFGLLRRFIRNDLASLHSDGVCVRIIGEREGLEPDIKALLKEAEDLTRHNTRLTLVVAFNAVNIPSMTALAASPIAEATTSSRPFSAVLAAPPRTALVALQARLIGPQQMLMACASPAPTAGISAGPRPSRRRTSPAGSWRR